jgi:superfamily II DNA or RNA helicase
MSKRIGDKYEAKVTAYLKRKYGETNVFRTGETRSSNERIPESWLEEIGLRDRADRGADMVVRNRDEFYCVQVKYRTDVNAVPCRRELASFTDELATRRFTKGIYITNCVRVHKMLEDRGEAKPIKIKKNFLPLTDEEITSVNNEIGEFISQKTKVKLRDFQLECLTTLANYTGQNGKITMACGTGKSYIMLLSHVILKSRLTVIFVPSLLILSQFVQFKKKLNHLGLKHVKMMSVCSEDEKSSDDTIHVTTEDRVDNILQFADDGGIIVVTYQSGMKFFLDVMKSQQVNLALYDEAHRTCVKFNPSSNNLSFADCITGISAERKFFFTATEKIYKSTKNDSAVKFSMSNLDIYGETVYRLTFDQAIEMRLINDYEVILFWCKDQEINEMYDNDTQRVLVKLKNFQNYKATPRDLFCAMQVAGSLKCHTSGIKKVLTYHHRVAGAQTFANMLRVLLGNNNEIVIQTFCGTTPKRKRDGIIEECKNAEKCVLCTARVLQEGVDLPYFDSVCFVDLRASLIDLVQCVGRVLRLWKDKFVSHVLIPVTEKEKDGVTSLSDDDVELLRNFLKSFVAVELQDSKVGKLQIAETVLSKCRNQKAYLNVVDISGVPCLDLSTYDEERIEKMIEEEVIYNVARYDIMWAKSYRKVKEFLEANKGKFPSVKSKDKKEKTLGIWCHTQRGTKRGTVHGRRLTPEQIKRLEALPGWVWDPDEQWNKKYEKVKEFLISNDEFPSQRSKDKKEKTLGNWCRTQRSTKRDTVHGRRLTPEQIKKLEALPGWVWDLDEQWNKKYEKVKEFRIANDGFPRQRSKDKKEKTLGNWCYTQRSTKRGTAHGSKLTAEQIQKLEALPGWVWDPDEKWNKKYEKVKEFRIANDRFPSDHTKDKEERTLGVWYNNQKYTKRGRGTRKLTPERIQKLEALPDWKWNKGDLTPFFTVLKRKVRKRSIKSKDELDSHREELGIEGVDLPKYYSYEFTTYEDLFGVKSKYDSSAVPVALKCIEILDNVCVIANPKQAKHFDDLVPVNDTSGVHYNAVIVLSPRNCSNARDIINASCNTYLTSNNRLIFVGFELTMRNNATWVFCRETINGVTIITAIKKIGTQIK